jgi:hypothetical protein
MPNAAEISCEVALIIEWNEAKGKKVLGNAEVWTRWMEHTYLSLLCCGNFVKTYGVLTPRTPLQLHTHFLLKVISMLTIALIILIHRKWFVFVRLISTSKLSRI